MRYKSVPFWHGWWSWRDMTSVRLVIAGLPWSNWNSKIPM
jgi:Sigma-54 interaction domain